MPSAVELARPEQRVGEQEVAHLVAPVVEDQRAPVRVLAAARVLVLVQRRAVEARERPGVAREVRRHPVEDHADAVRVHAVDERAEVVGRAEARRRRVVRRHLVAPRAAERVRHDRQQLDVREAEVRRRRRRARRRARGRSASGCPPAGSAATSRGAPRRSTSAGRAAGPPRARRGTRRRSTRTSSACTIDAVCGGSSVSKANGSAFSSSSPDCARISNL